MREQDRFDQDPFETLRDLIDEPVLPREAFADELRSRLMRERSASERSREEHSQPMDAVIASRPAVAFPGESTRRIRPMVLLELAAAAVIILGLATVLSRSWFQNDPDTPPSVPAVAQQDDETPTSAAAVNPTEVPAGDPTTASTLVIATVASDGTLATTEAPAGTVPGTVWTLPATEGESVDFGGMLVEDGVIYRLLATPSFVGVQAVDGQTGTVRWQQAHQWAGTLFALEDGTLFLDGGSNRLGAIDAKTGAEKWRAQVTGNPIDVTEGDDSIFVLLDSDFVTALDAATGQQRWIAQGTVPQNPTGGSASMPAIGKIAEEDGIVVAVSTYGVLSGFDAASGQELWSQEGYDAASVSITTDNNRIIVIDGAGPETAVGFGIGTGGPATAIAVGTPGEAAVAASANGQSGGAGAAAGCGVVFGTAGAAVTVGGVSNAGAADGTPEAGVSVAGMAGMTVRVQGIDPKTGEVVWAQQTAPGAVAGAVQGSDPASAAMEICAVDVENGAMTSVTVGGSPIAGTAGVEAGQVVVGSISNGTFTTAQVAGDDDAGVASLTTGTIDGFDQPVIAAAGDESGMYLQLQDGTLVKIEAGQRPVEVGQQDAAGDAGPVGTPVSNGD